MPSAIIQGAHIAYEIVGDRGPAVALSPGGRSPMGDMRVLADRIAAAGYRVLLHDRRNCGASDVVIDPGRPEYEIWADDLNTLLGQLGMLPAIVGGSSSGARLALAFALKYSAAVKALLLIRVTGGRFAVDRLVEKYSDQYSRAADIGGMAAVCETEHFAETIRLNPRNRRLLMETPPARFVACMEAWRAHFLAGIDLPLIGTSAADLASIKVPVCIIPGNDLTHPGDVAQRAGRLMPNCEIHRVTTIERDVDVTPAEEWSQHYPDMAAVFTTFLQLKRLSPPS